ncbi:MAG TPA: TerC family protein [Alphaproteobacteria bacterium]|nr:TerC family protein [Alphaproteobacteria bacterium]
MEFLDQILWGYFLGKQGWFWLVFISIVIFLLFLDLGVFHRHDHEISVKESLYMSLGYILIALAFGGWVWYSLGPTAGKDYLTGFLVEKTLAIDNIFVISLIFTYFAIPRLYQHRILFWGIIGVIILRGIMIGLGSTLVQEYHWILYIFAVFLILTGIKMLVFSQQETNLEKNVMINWLRRILPVTDSLRGNHFFVREKAPNSNKKRLYVTPLFLALIMVEFTDLIFAVDSVPAIFAITQDTYIVYTSNIFAILGLRALYFALAAIIHKFHYLKYALAIILIFIGGKIFIADFFGGKFPADLSLIITIGLLASGVIYSIWKTRQKAL